MNRDDLVRHLASVVTASLHRPERRSPYEAYALGQLVREPDYPRDEGGGASRDADAVARWLAGRLTGRQYPENAVAVTLDGEVLAVHGVPTGKTPDGGGVLTYTVRTVEDALRVHYAWRAWVDARVAVGVGPKAGRTLRQARADELHAEFVRIRDALDYVRPPDDPAPDYDPPPGTAVDPREAEWVSTGKVDWGPAKTGKVDWGPVKARVADADASPAVVADALSAVDDLAAADRAKAPRGKTASELAAEAGLDSWPLT